VGRLPFDRGRTGQARQCQEQPRRGARPNRQRGNLGPGASLLLSQFTSTPSSDSEGGELLVTGGSSRGRRAREREGYVAGFIATGKKEQQKREGKGGKASRDDAQETRHRAEKRKNCCTPRKKRRGKKARKVSRRGKNVKRLLSISGRYSSTSREGREKNLRKDGGCEIDDLKKPPRRWAEEKRRPPSRITPRTRGENRAAPAKMSAPGGRVRGSLLCGGPGKPSSLVIAKTRRRGANAGAFEKTLRRLEEQCTRKKMSSTSSGSAITQHQVSIS